MAEEFPWLNKVIDDVLSEPEAPGSGDRYRCRIIVEVQSTHCYGKVAVRKALKILSEICMELYADDIEETTDVLIFGGHTAHIYVDEIDKEEAKP